MLTGRAPYHRLIDPSGTIPDDEPVFVIRASDVTAVEHVLEWARRVRSLGASADTVGGAIAQADEIAAWQQKHGCKVPGL